MSDIKFYSVVFRDNGLPSTGLSPSVTGIYDLATGTGVTPVPTIAEIALGIYNFSIDWSNAGYDGVTDIVMQIDSGDLGMSDADRYVYGNLSRRDNDSLYSISTTIEERTDVQILGNWTIQNNQLTLYKSDSSLYATYDLFDINGDPTNISATSRIKV